jgi:hypothetical protein
VIERKAKHEAKLAELQAKKAAKIDKTLTPKPRAAAKSARLKMLSQIMMLLVGGKVVTSRTTSTVAVGLYLCHDGRYRPPVN